MHSNRASHLSRATWVAAFLSLVAWVGPAAPAAAQSSPSEVYDAVFESVTDNCPKKVGYALGKEKLTVERKGRRGVELKVAKLPPLSGSQRRGGKIRAEANDTNAKGRRRLKVSGRIEQGELQLLLIAEIYDQGSSSSCSQSWNVTGRRANGSAR